MCSDYLFQAILNCFFYDSNIDKPREYKTYQTRQQNIVPVVNFEILTLIENHTGNH